MRKFIKGSWVIATVVAAHVSASAMGHTPSIVLADEVTPKRPNIVLADEVTPKRPNIVLADEVTPKRPNVDLHPLSA
jgi:hypothetical protein